MVSGLSSTRQALAQTTTYQHHRLCKAPNSSETIPTTEEVAADAVEADVTAAYLHSYLKEEIYCRPPYGAEEYDSEGNLLYWKMLKSIYGLRQSGHNWMEDMFSFLTGFGLVQSLCDTSLFELYKDGKIVLIVFVHTDDGKCAYKDHAVYDEFFQALSQKFNIGANKSVVDRMFNVKVNYLPDGSVLLNQEQYIRNLCKTYNIVPDPRVDSPMSTTTNSTRRRKWRDILDEFLTEAQAATDSTDAFCEYFVAHLVSLHWPGGTIHGNQHALQSYLKKDDDVLNYENLRTVRGWVGLREIGAIGRNGASRSTRRRHRR